MAEEADSEETVIVLLDETETEVSAEGTVTVVLEERPTPRPSATGHLHTENLAEKTSFNKKYECKFLKIDGVSKKRREGAKQLTKTLVLCCRVSGKRI